ncbi:piggyBac transposable element-derived protein 4-like [Pleuronectes platessa]|uniref:piggyBac transposable element-derived protein 4-like n=1 Tax=Pleuronectes platessa TaxID=8262 RepID=UPI00232A5E0C|nr:piggyBac transposable element-derived protein 4-like [Pleuronectes platessa]
MEENGDGIGVEPEIEEDVSEIEDNDPYFDPDHHETEQSTNGEEEAPEEEAPGEEAPVEDTPEVTFQSKDGNLLWYSSPQDRGGRTRGENIIRMSPGPTRYATSRVDDIKSSFQLFLPESIVEIILAMTNLEGGRVFADTWKALDQVDLQAYMGLLILAGVHRSNNEATKSLWDAESGRPIFRSTMSLQQFHVLSRIIRFDDRATRPFRWRDDKLAAIRNVWDRWVERLPLMYNPGPEVTVDERLVPFRGRCPFKQYIPSKPGKYGIKIWAACDARSSYAWNMQVYTGKPVTGRPEKNQGMRVVLDMTAGLKGHNITCDNFFTSHGLGQELLKRKLTMVGTVRKNKPQLPPALVSTRGREALSSKFAFTDTHSLVSYLPKKNKNVILMSTLHKDAAVSEAEHRKPQIILDYNRNKGGVDCLDKLTGTYTCKRMTARWPVAVFHNILDVTACNAYVVWTAIDPAWNQGKRFKRRLFLAELGKALVTPLIQRRQHRRRNGRDASYVPYRDNKTSLTCFKCDAYVCKTHCDLIAKCHSCV